MLDDIVVVGLMGEACTGKTVTAQTLAPIARLGMGDPKEPVWFQHIFFARPLYEIMNVKKKIEGPGALDRQSYEIHRILTEMWPSPIYGAPPYKDLVEIVRQVVAYRLPEDEKPRDFMQWLGTEVCREIDPDCFINLTRRRMTEEYHHWRKEGNPKQLFAVVISDVRFLNEVEFIKSNPRSLVVKLECEESVRQDRSLDRDGVLITPEQNQHRSECGADYIHPDLIDLTIDTTEYSIADVAASIRYEVVGSYFG